MSPTGALTIHAGERMRPRGEHEEAEVVAAMVADVQDHAILMLASLGVDYGQGYFPGRPRRLADHIAATAAVS